MTWCLDCQFWEELSDDATPYEQREGYCHLYPPVSRQNGQSIYQMTSVTDWCSQGESKYEVPDLRWHVGIAPAELGLTARRPGQQPPREGGQQSGSRQPLDVVSPTRSAGAVGKVSLPSEKK